MNMVSQREGIARARRAKIGGRRADPTDSTTHSGAQDEVAIWLNRTLTDEEALALYEELKAKYPDSPDARNVDLYISRLK